MRHSDGAAALALRLRHSESRDDHGRAADAGEFQVAEQFGSTDVGRPFSREVMQPWRPS